MGESRASRGRRVVHPAAPIAASSASTGAAPRTESSFVSRLWWTTPTGRFQERSRKGLGSSSRGCGGRRPRRHPPSAPRAPPAHTSGRGGTHLATHPCRAATQPLRGSRCKPSPPRAAARPAARAPPRPRARAPAARQSCDRDRVCERGEGRCGGDRRARLARQRSGSSDGRGRGDGDEGTRACRRRRWRAGAARR